MNSIVKAFVLPASVLMFTLILNDLLNLFMVMGHANQPDRPEV